MTNKRWQNIGLETNYKPGPVVYVNFPIPPKELIDKLPSDIQSYEGRIIAAGGYFKRSDNYSKELNEWCQKNISKDLKWDIQTISKDLFPHKDQDISRKLILLIKTGNNKESVYTYFYKETNILDNILLNDKIINPLNVHKQIENEITHKIEIESMKWHILTVDKNHSVFGIEEGNCRIGLVANIS
jgi:hypothetical protein